MKVLLRKANFPLLAYLSLLQSELLIARSLSDLEPGTLNWTEKARQILAIHIPSDNFYGPGAALLVLPFVLFGISAYFANHFYFALGALAFWRICSEIPSKTGRNVALMALPLNLYLIWLIDSSQDTVFEFFLLTWATYFLIHKRIGYFAITGFLLCETRAGYWIYYLGVSGFLFVRSYLISQKIAWGKIFAVYFLVASSFFNFINYNSYSPALEGGITAYFGYTKYHYLALPKMDMDVFLSGQNGAFSTSNGPNIPAGSTPAQVNSIYQNAALESAVKNRKETVLGWMQKFDSYFFDVQKIPHLPGEYVLDQDKKIIVIGNERLSWALVAGNLTYMLYRSVLVTTGLISVGILCALISLRKKVLIQNLKFMPLASPFLFGAVPGILIYSETRFKIVSELLLCPLIVGIMSTFKKERHSSTSIRD